MFQLIIICSSLVILTIDVADGRHINSLPAGITLHNVIQTWAEAQTHCATEGAVLASPINENVFNSMKSVIDVKNTTFYIGAKSTDSNGCFISVEGIPIEDMTVAMINMSPQLDPLDGDCLAMNSDSIRVVPCWSRLPYMCLTTENNTLATENKTPVVENTTPNNTEIINASRDFTTPEENMNDRFISDGYIYSSLVKKYYKLHSEMMNWDEAQMACFAEGAHLATIANENEAAFIKNMYDFNDDDWIHIGLRLVANGWQSIQGQPITELFDKWKSGTAPSDEDLSCGSLHKDGRLDDMYCHLKQPFVCQKDNVI